MLEGKEEKSRGSKVLLLSKVQVKEPKEVRMEDLKDSNIKWMAKQDLPPTKGLLSMAPFGPMRHN